MMINDRLYGDLEVVSPAVLELMNTAAFTRLKGIAQLGMPDKYFDRPGFSRYEHSVGVYVLLNKLGAAEEEQIAGLLHDISHTAFSHLVDWVIAPDYQKSEDYQNDVHLSVLKQPEISNILQRYAYTAEQMADHGRYHLLERNIPDLCADRVDYSLRQTDQATVTRCLPSIISFKGEMVFADEPSALIFADNFLNLQKDCWGGYEAVTRYSILSELLKTAIKNQDLVFDDLLATDQDVLNKIVSTGKKKYLDTLKLLENKDLSFLPKTETPIVKKFRHVDPMIATGRKTVRLSEINTNFKKRLKEARALNAQGVRPGAFSIS